MKELISIAGNLGGVVSTKDGRITPQLEIVVIFAEKAYRWNDQGGLISESQVNRMGVMTTPENLRKLAQDMLAQAAIAERRFAEALVKSMPEMVKVTRWKVSGEKGPILVLAGTLEDTRAEALEHFGGSDLRAELEGTEEVMSLIAFSALKEFQG